MSSNQRRRIESTCNFLCFKDCDETLDKNTSINSQLDEGRPDKISLKKIL